MTNQDMLALLSCMAPKEPDNSILDEWHENFNKDYPAPWVPSIGSEFVDACLACSAARSASDSALSIKEFDTTARGEGLDDGGQKFWYKWRDECLDEWTRNEWPLIWAKNRIQAASS